MKNLSPSESEFREMTPHERAMLMKLLEPSFPGRDELLTQVAHAVVHTRLPDGTFIFKVNGGKIANTPFRVPVEVTLTDSDGIPIEILLHVVEGRLNELEIIKYSDDPIQAMLDPREWEPKTHE